MCAVCCCYLSFGVECLLFVLVGLLFVVQRLVLRGVLIVVVCVWCLCLLSSIACDLLRR